MSELQTEKWKAFHASRTVWWNYLALALNWFLVWRFPLVKELYEKHSTVVVACQAVLFTGFCMVNLWLRKTTSCRIGKPMAFLFALLLTGCASQRPQCVTYRTQNMEVMACDSIVSISHLE